MHLINIIQRLTRSGNSISGSGRFWGWARLLGNKNTVELGKGARLIGYCEMRGSGNRIIIEADCVVSAAIFVKGKNQTLRVSRGTTIRRGYILLQEQCDVTIGRECLFSRGVEIRTTDAHSLFDTKTGRRLNVPGDVRIGDRVWVGTRSLLSKGTTIADGCVVGAMSFVSGVFDESGVVIAGVPARVIRKGVTWKRQRAKHLRNTKSQVL